MLDRKNPKLNCFEIQSPPSAGKNYFIDPILLVMGTFGQITNANINNMLAYDNCFNKRVALMNEPRFENAFRERLLMVFLVTRFQHEASIRMWLIS
jgi:hypothetical protein